MKQVSKTTELARYHGRVALVTGGLGAMGLAIGRRLTEEGAIVYLADLTADDAGRITEAYQGVTLPKVLTLDVSSAESWDEAINTILAESGALHLLVNNAGVITPVPQPITDIPLDEFHRVLKVNLDGVLLGTQAALKAMKQGAGAAIVNLGSLAAYTGSADNGTYGVSKGAVRSLTKHAALSAARNGHDVRINVVHPGYVWTPLVAAKAAGQFGTEDAAREAFSKMNPSGRIVEPCDVAAAIAFLGSSDARMIHGADLVIDGGRLIQ
ncbi:SDR family oxidoreductase [Brucellaceae bacterium VT-16-1752]|uniref:SDR family oxidoreductase n=2 Tax=Ochrobactrum TaxID=528 RepID=A0ABY2Y2F5_9HYPH|nr:SDR family oxidoreductase [[Ochrobactrum] soli]RRD26379.1 SDR family oxidoreductase [Brucellaceae bacterium VT-16-1752]TNV14069.1 SDR family oxidoreductase [[Ochrobactrum] teleogrylli]